MSLGQSLRTAFWGYFLMEMNVVVHVPHILQPTTLFLLHSLPHLAQAMLPINLNLPTQLAL